MIIDEVIAYLKEHKMPTAAISDCIGKTGVIHGIGPVVSPTIYSVGKMHVVFAVNKSNWYMHEKMQRAEPGSVIYVHCENCGEFAALGELVSVYCVKHLHAAAVVINGLVRDVEGLVGLPVWAKGVTPLGCFNAKPKLSPDDEEGMARIEAAFENSIMACDDSGVVVILNNIINNELLPKLEKMRQREESWFAGLKKGLSTFEIVCEGKT